MLPVLALLGAAAFLAVLFLKLRAKAASGSDKGAAKAKLQVQVQAVEQDAADAKPVVRILYGTQTGTAERFSKSLGAQLRKKFAGAVVEVRAR